MAILGAAVAIVGVLCVLDLLLTFGVIRRLREHTELLSRFTGPDMRVSGLVTGEPVTSFSAVTLAGELLNGVHGLRVAGFFSAGCSACPERVGPFAEYVASHRLPGDSVLSVVVADGEPPSYSDRLRETGQVCVVPDDSEIVKAFKVTGFPAFCLLDADGALMAAGYDPAVLPAPV